MEKMKKSARAEEVREYLIQNIPHHPADIVAVAADHFRISRPAIHKHLRKLIADGAVKKDGTTRAARYLVVRAGIKTWKIKVHPNLQEDEIWEKYLAPEVEMLPTNLLRICLYGFTEMMNNVIDHSKATDAKIELTLTNTAICIGIRDNGVGIFRKIQKALSLPDIKESLLHLSKGKFTTDPAKHTGEGIFFTSRAFEEFRISSGELEYICFSEGNDWLIQTLESDAITGTHVEMQISRNSKRELDRIFKEYSDSEYSFNKTNVFVKLAKLRGEKYISRSQAKRLLLGLDKFKKIILDFKEVPSVGQAFVDEVFRVFKNAHPEIEIGYVNANENVEFMLQRGLSVMKQ